MPLLAAATVLSAFLLFLIQPLAGKQLLPLFGGSGAVWSACLLFFQFVLLAGYIVCPCADAVVPAPATGLGSRRVSAGMPGGATV